MNRSTQNYQRFDAFYELQEQSISLLHNPAVTGALGATAEQLTNCIEQTYPLCVGEYGNVDVPKSEESKENMGILIILPEDNPNNMNVAPYFSSLLPSQLQKIAENGQSGFLLNMAVQSLIDNGEPEYPYIDSQALAVHKGPIRIFHPPLSKTQNPIVIHLRGMMLYNGIDTSTAIPLIHEAAHHQFMKQMTDAEPALYYIKADERLRTTWDERQAYRVGAKVLLAADEIIMPVPHEAKYVLEAVTTGVEYDSCLDMAARQRRVNTGVAAIDVLLGQPEGRPSDKEISMYSCYGLAK